MVRIDFMSVSGRFRPFLPNHHPNFKRGVFMKSVLEKNWVSPFVALSFLIISVTGILMLLHVKSHAVSVLHEWMGLIFVIAGALHLILNWKAFLSCFLEKKSSFAVILVLVLASLLLFGGMFGEQRSSDFTGQGGYPQTHRR